MFSVTLLAVGKLKEKFYIKAAEEYQKRLGAYVALSLVELPEQRLSENPSEAEIAQALEKEADAIERKLPKGAWLCVLTPEGKELSSPELADTLAKLENTGKSAACFLIGSSFGMAQRLKDRADLCLSMGKMTFPHHLARIMALEQLYRAQAILHGSKYHK